MGIEDQRLQRVVRVSRGGGTLRNDCLAQLVHPVPELSGDQERRVGVQAEIVVDLLLHTLDVRAGGRSILLMTGMISRLCSMAMYMLASVCASTPWARVDEQHRSLAGRDGTRDLVGKVHVPRGVDEVQDVLDAIFRRVRDRDRLALDRDAAFPLDVHVVQDLVVELPVGHQARTLDEPVGECRLAVIDVGNDAEVAYSRGFQVIGV